MVQRLNLNTCKGYVELYIRLWHHYNAFDNFGDTANMQLYPKITIFCNGSCNGNFTVNYYDVDVHMYNTLYSLPVIIFLNRIFLKIDLHSNKHYRRSQQSCAMSMCKLYFVKKLMFHH